MEAWLGVHITFVSGLFVVVAASTGVSFFVSPPVGGLDLVTNREGVIFGTVKKIQVNLRKYPNAAEAVASITGTTISIELELFGMQLLSTPQCYNERNSTLKLRTEYESFSAVPP